MILEWRRVEKTVSLIVVRFVVFLSFFFDQKPNPLFYSFSFPSAFLVLAFHPSNVVFCHPFFFFPHALIFAVLRSLKWEKGLKRKAKTKTTAGWMIELIPDTYFHSFPLLWSSSLFSSSFRLLNAWQVISAWEIMPHPLHLHAVQAWESFSSTSGCSLCYYLSSLVWERVSHQEKVAAEKRLGEKRAMISSQWLPVSFIC